MDANELEKSYQEITRGRVEPDVAYILGRTLKEWAALAGKPCTVTTDGFSIVDDEMFMVTSEGIWRVE